MSYLVCITVVPASYRFFAQNIVKNMNLDKFNLVFPCLSTSSLVFIVRWAIQEWQWFNSTSTLPRGMLSTLKMINRLLILVKLLTYDLNRVYLFSSEVNIDSSMLISEIRETLYFLPTTDNNNFVHFTFILSITVYRRHIIFSL